MKIQNFDLFADGGIRNMIVAGSHIKCRSMRKKPFPVPLHPSLGLAWNLSVKKKQVFNSIRKWFQSCDLHGPECQIFKKRPIDKKEGLSEVDAGILASSNQGLQVQ